jgi:hypothetical protein
MLIAVAVALSAVAPSNAGQSQMAALLGSPDATYLIVHADDMGMCHSENQATFNAMERGLVTCGSVMMPCPWVMEVVQFAKSHPDVDLGVHLTLNSEWSAFRWRPLSPPDKVPGLIDPEGYMWRSVEDVVKHATPAEVEAECRAQIQRAIDLGLRPTHIDTHMGAVVATPEFAQVYLKLGREFRLPVMLPKVMLEDGKDTTPSVARPLLKQMEASGVPLLDALAGTNVSASSDGRRAAYAKVIEGLPRGASQIIVHLGLDDDELKAITSFARTRYWDYLAFTHPETRRIIQDRGIRLIGWRPIMQALRSKAGEG